VILTNTNIKVLSGIILKVSGGNLILKFDATGDASVIAFGSVAHSDGGKAIVQGFAVLTKEGIVTLIIFYRLKYML